MTEFQMPMASIPNSKIYINEATMKKILLQNHGTTFNHTKGFTSLFTNVVCENMETSTACSSHKNIAGTLIAPPPKNNFRYHARKPQMNNEVSLTRVHRMPVDKKIIRTTIMPKIKQEESFCDPGLSLVPINREFRSQSYKERPSYVEQFIQKRKSRIKLDPPQEITGKSFDLKMYSPMRNEQTETEIMKQVNIMNIKMEIEKALERCSPKRQPEIPEQVPQKVVQSYMFIEDDRDRFGKQIYPISMPQPSPGPGQYDTDLTSLHHRLNKIQERNTQKRLVQLWQQQF